MRLSTKKVIISILLGLAGFWCSRYSLSFNNPPFSITITWSYFLPLLAGMAYGPLYGLIAGTVGLDAFFPFLLYPNNGWACLVNSIPFVIWFSLYGYSEQLRRLKPTFWNHPFVVHLPFAVFFVLFMRIFFPVAFSLNPPFWNPQAELSMPIPILESVITKGIIVMYLAVIFDICILTIPHVRKLFDLEIKKESRNNAWIVLVSLLSSALLWYVSIIFNRIFIDKTFPQGLFQSSDPRENLSLLVFLVAGLLMGTIISQYVESRLKAEDELEKSRESYRLIFEQAADGIFITDTSGHYVDVNNAGCNLTGYTRDEILQLSTVDMVFPGEETNVQIRINSINAGDTPVFERKMRHKNGFPIQVEISGRKLADGRLQGLVHDISDRKRAEVALQESAARFQSLFNDSPISLWEEDFSAVKNCLEELRASGVQDFDAHLRQHPEVVAHCIASVRVINVNKASLALYEAASQAEMLVNLSVIIPEEGFESFRKEMLLIASGLTHFEMEFINQTLGGKKKTVNLNWTVMPGYEADLSRIIVSLIDITERKLAEAKIKFQAILLDSVGQAVIATDLNGTIIYFNRAAEELYGWPAAEALGRNIMEVTVSETSQAQAEEIMASLREGRAWSGEFNVQHRDGTVFPAVATDAPVLDEAGKLIGIIGVSTDITERKQSEKALHESEKRFRLALRNSPLPIMLHAEDGEVILISQTWTDLTGYTLEDIPTTTLWTQKAYGERQQMVNSKIDNLYDLEQRTNEGEFVIQTKDGKKLTWEFSASMLGKLSDGRRLVISMAVDVTVRKDAELKLIETSAILQAALDNSQTGIAIADAPDGKLRYVNQAGLLIPDKPENELVDGVDADHYISRWQILHFDGTPLLTDEVPLTRAIRYGEKNSKEFIIRRANAEDRYVWANAAPILDEAGKIVAGIVVFLDITASRLAEETLKKSEQQFRTLFEQAAVGVAITDAQNGQILRINQHYCDILGYSAEEMLNKTYLVYTHPDDVQISNEKKQLLLQGAIREFSIEKRYIHKDGSLVWVEISVSAMWEPGEAPTSYVTVIQDISSRKEGEDKLNMTYAEMQHLLVEADKSRKVLLNVVEDQKLADVKLSRLNAELETRVRERTIQLEVTNQELEAFAYSISHDLRAPLRGIDGWSAVLMEDYHDLLDENGRQSLERVRSETKRMGQLIDDMLKLSRVTRVEMKWESINLSALAQTINARLHEADAQRHVKVILQPELFDNGDPDLLEILLTNLLSNAWKFTGKQPQAVIEFGKTLVGGKAAYFVRDNGTGFDMAYANKLFVPFQRLHSAKEYPGTGIGLSIVQRVIARHGGHIWSESEIGKGTTFYFTLGKNA